MSATSRELVRQCLRFEHPARLPRELWALPWAYTNLPAGVAELNRRFPGDFGGPPDVYAPAPRRHGDMYAIGTYVDEWGCTFTNLQAGVIGEVRTPLIHDAADWQQVQPPYETLPPDPAAARDRVNRACAASPAYMRGGCCPRPWERYQFIRGTANAMLDMAEPDEPGVRELLAVIHQYYLREIEFWVTTDVDGICFMDDWGSQWQLLINPTTWRALFKPLYRDYCQLIHAHGKAAWMHTDGFVEPIYPDLVEVGVDALNSQLFCMDLPTLARAAKGKLTFWGEIDRQHVLPNLNPQAGRDAVRQVAKHLYDPAGGIIAQFELTAGSNPDVALAIYDEWDKVHAEALAAAT